MKKVVRALVLIVVAIVSFVIYKSYKRANPPSDFSYKIPAQIDTNYYSKSLLNNYFDLCYELEETAQSLWYNEFINVHQKDLKEPMAMQAKRRYMQKLRFLKGMEAKLLESANLKGKGFSNYDIQEIERIGLSQYQKNKADLSFEESTTILAEKGQTSQFILWMQTRLNLQGADIREDGIFDTETEEAVTSFQQDNKLSPTGLMDKLTYKLLVQTQAK